MGGGTAAPAAATYSGTVPAGGSNADSGSSQASASSSDLAAASGGANAQVPATDTGAQDAAVTSAAAAAAMAGTPQPANTGKARSENSYDSDASASALEAAAEAAPAAASAPEGRSGMRAAAALATQDAANAPMVVDAGKHTHAGFDLAALADNTGGAAAGLSQLSANASVGAPADAAPTAALRIHASVDGADFTQGLSDRVSWMVDNGVNGAKLQVNPPQLGPIELRISVQGDHAQVWMTTHSAVARDALESSSPKLREMLNAQGFGQVSVDISQRSFQDRSAYTPPYQRESAGDRGTAVTPAAATTGASMTAGSTPRTLLGALDAYA
jgi:flagellar hook-length control protein FliK